ncbi:hypothetical protein [Niastella sp. OAS944]|uniref:hypothetical protein n=1 Tax=Niastella sp. OAS944 TaxID=2664089 RepID=UPI0034751F61|nr:hypothetical protein [Chitinophagaceae bacterium OAS944]
MGGNLRLQVPNEIAMQSLPTIKLASGTIPNPFFTAIDMPAPLIVSDSPLQKLELKKTWVYDVNTKKGQVYEFSFI